ncbi:hypothetical protein EVAR_189_1 [Eumeta japonica]|uniref:Uncharacterized protein n=1 Tax=Eumeta variegata TaxID=151549 RepID=A0A4C1S917_EUMVA|nr:hypothetical protein EVAR_189_1 [Eumeta japonica]
MGSHNRRQRKPLIEAQRVSAVFDTTGPSLGRCPKAVALGDSTYDDAGPAGAQSDRYSSSTPGSALHITCTYLWGCRRPSSAMRASAPSAQRRLCARYGFLNFVADVTSSSRVIARFFFFADCGETQKKNTTI